MSDSSDAGASPLSPVAGAFKRRQSVRIQHSAAVGSEIGRIVRADRQLAGWYIVRFDDGAKACISATSLQAA